MANRLVFPDRLSVLPLRFLPLPFPEDANAYWLQFRMKGEIPIRII